jgi:hypothetical protein
MKKVVTSSGVFSPKPVSTVLLKYLLVLLLLTGANAVWAQKTWDGGGDGVNWSSANNWSPNGLPASTDAVTIVAGQTVTVDIATAVCAALNLSPTSTGMATLNFNSGSKVTASGVVTLGQSGNNNRRGTIDMTSGGTLVCTGLALGNASGANVFTAGTGTVQLTATNTLPSTSTVISAFNNLTITAGTTTLWVSTSVSGTLTQSGGNIAVGANTLTVNGIHDAGTNTVSGAGGYTLAATGTLITANAGGVNSTITATTQSLSAAADYTFNGTVAQNTGTNLPTNLTGTLTINSTNTVTLNATRTIASGGTLNIIAGTFAAGNNLTMATTSSVTRSGGTVTGTFQGTGVYNVTYTGNSMTTYSELSGSGLSNITVNLTAGQTLSLDQTRAPDGSLSVSSGIFNLATFTINRSAAGGTLTVSDGATLKIAGTNAIPSNYSTHAIGAASTIEYAGTGQTVSSLNSSQTYGNLTTSGSGTKALQAATTVAGILTIGSGTTLDVTASNFALNVAGNFTNGGTFNGRTGTVTLNGAAQTIGGTSATTFNNLSLSGGTKTFGLATTVSANLSIATGAVANFGSITTHTANTLTLGGNGTAAGTFGSTSSAATRKNNTFFTAGTTGLITVAASGCTAPSLTSVTAAAICAGSTTYSIAYTGSTGSPDLYSISGTGITTVSNAALTASPLTINLSAGAIAGTITPASFTVANSATGCVSANLGGAVTVNASPSLTATGASATALCSGSTATITLSGILNVAQTISYTVGGTAGTQTASVTGVGGSASFSTIALTAANSAQTITITGITRTDVTPNCTFTPGGSNTAALPTVNATPTLTGTSTGATALCSGSTATITLSGILNVAQTISYTVGGTAGIQTASVTGVGGTASFSTIALTTANSGQTVTITNIATASCSFAPSANRTATLPTLNATGTWIGTTTNWFTPSNWCGGVPTASTDVIIPAGGTQPAINATGAVCNNITIAGTLTFSGTGYLTVAGNLTNNGTITAGTGTTIEFNAATQTVSGSSTTAFRNLTVNSSTSLSLNTTASVAGVLSIPTAKTLLVNNITLTISGSGAVSGTLRNTGAAGTITATGLTFNSGGTYDHNRDGGAIPTATWNAASNCNITGVVATVPTVATFAQTFGNLNWNSSGQTAALSLVGNLTTINGNFTIGAMNGGSLRLSNGGVTATLSVAGNFSQTGASTFYFGGTTSANTWTVNVAGDFSLATGTLNMSGFAASVSTLNVAGNFSISSGTLTFASTGTNSINFSGTATQFFSKTGGTIAGAITFTINNNAIVDFGTSVLNGTGPSFTLSSGGRLVTANTNGVTGTITVTGTKTFASGARYEFNSTAANQSTGFAGLTINNPNSITVSNTFGTVTPDVNITFGNAATLNVNAGSVLVAAATRTFTFGTGGVVNVNGTIRTANTTATDALSGSATSTIVSTNTPTINLNSGSVIEFNGTAAQFAAARTFAGLAVNNSSGVTMLGNITTTTLGLTTGNLFIGTNTLTINGTVSRTAGNIAGAHTANLTIGGTAGSLFFDQTGTNNYLKNFTINTAASATLGNALNITGGTSINNEGVLTVTGTGVLTTGGNLTIKSNANGTAAVAAGNTAGGYVSGDVTVERYIPQNASKAWRLLASNTSGQTIKQAWQENQTGFTSNTNPGFGTMIPGKGVNVAAAQANGFDSLSRTASIFKYNPSTDNLDALTNTSSTLLGSEHGYFIFIRGDRSANQFGAGTPSTSTVLRSKGALFQGTQSAVSIAASQYALVRNPYASRIDMRQIVRTGGLVDAYQVWDPKLAGASGVGGYQTFTKNLISGNYEIAPGGGSYGAIGSVQNFIESGDAFFVQATGSTGTVQVLESCKASGSQVVFRPSSPLGSSSRMLFNIYANNVGSTDLVDGGYVDFDDTYSNAVDMYDVRKSPNFGENFGMLRNNTELVVERRKSVTGSDSVFFKMSQLRQLSYRLDFSTTGFDAGQVTAVLQDKFTGVNTTLNLAATTSYTFTVTGVAGSFATDRFRLVFSTANTFTGTGNWTDNARWSTGTPPASGERITIAAGANAILNTDFTVGTSLTMDATSTLVVSPAKTLTVANTGIVNFNGQLVTFKSDNTGYGSLGQVNGILNGATNVTVERYIPNNGFRSWRLLSVPTYGNGQTIRNAWQEGTINPLPLQNNLPGFGTQISGTGSVTAAQSAGFDNTSAAASLFSWSGTAWSPLASTNLPIANIKAYFLYLRGDRTIGVTGGITNSSATTLRTNGTIYSGDQLSNVGAGAFALIPNLYPSAINFTGLPRTGGVSNLFYIWDSKKQNGSSLGAYQTFSGTNGFMCLLSGGSYTFGQSNTTIESGQAFFVQSTTAGTITLKETAKISGSNGNLGFRPSATPAKIDSRLYNASNEMLDANVVVFDAAYANAVDGDDAPKMGNPGANFAIETYNKLLAIEGRGMVSDNDVIQFRMWNLQQQSYKLEVAASHIAVPGVVAMLEDSYLHTSTPLNLEGATTIDFTVDATPVSSAANRFRIVFKQPAVLPVSFVSVSGSRSAAGIKVDWKVATERNVVHYTIERSADGNSFAGIHTVNVTASTASEKTYSITDAAAPEFALFYRVKSTDANGAVKYSMIVKVEPANVKAAYTVSPNPVVNGILNLQVKNQAAGRYSVMLLNNLGQASYSKVIQHSGGSANISMELPSNLTDGIYQLQILSPENSNTTQKIVVQRKD